MKRKYYMVLFLLLIISFLGRIEVKASEKFQEGNYIPNLWVNKEKNGKIRYQQARFLTRTSDNQYAYCIEPWEEISNTTNYFETIDVNSIDNSTWQKMALTAYYGYGYKNHTDSKWYYITQVIIWRLADPNANFYFTDKLNGKKITIYDSDIREIEQLVNRHFITPDFNASKLTLMLGDKISLIDKNNVLSNFKIKTNNNIQIEQINSMLNIRAIKEGMTEIIFTKEDTRFQTPPIVYYHPEKQDFLTVGTFNPIIYKLPIEILSGSITIEKQDQDNNSQIPSGEASLKGSKFAIYDSNQKLVQEINMDNSLTAQITNLPTGTYTIREIKAGEGYLINKDEQIVTINKEQKNHHIIFKNKVIEKEIIIEKFYGKNEIWSKEEGVIFEIYDNQNKKITEVITNENGIAKITLPYGKYTVKQKNGKSNYEKTEDFTITISNNEDQLLFQKYDIEKTGKLIIIKLDKETGEIIRENSATFEITHLESNKSWKISTNKEGFVILDNLSYGTYSIKEIKAPSDYHLEPKQFYITIDDNQKEQVLEIKNEKEVEHTVEVPNTSTFQIERVIYYDPKKYYYYTYNINHIEL